MGRETLIYHRIGGEQPKYFLRKESWKDILREILNETIKKIEEESEEFEIEVKSLSIADWERERDFKKRVLETFEDSFFDVIQVERWFKSFKGLYYWDTYRIVYH